MENRGSGLTALGVVASLALIAVLLCVGIGVVIGGRERDAPALREVAAPEEPPAALELLAPEPGVPRLDPAAPYVPKDGIVEVEISEYAGYAGLIVANGGLAPNPESWFARNAGFQVKLIVSEEDAWSRLNSGKLAATATTVDVLPLYGRQFEAVVPVQIGFSRGADGVVVRNDVRKLNDLRGRTLVTQQFGESEFFLRYLAQEAGIPVTVGDSPAAPDPNAIHLVFAEDAFAAGDVFAGDAAGALAGCVTWDPKTGEVVEASNGTAHVLVTNRNLLVIADILVVNKGFATQNPAMVAGLVEGLLVGNARVRADARAESALVAAAFGWTAEEAAAELTKVHLSNLPENLAFFGGEIDMAGSFGGIFQSSVLAYGREIVREVVPPERFVDTTSLAALQKAGKFADEKVAIAPIRGGGTGSVEDDPLLSKDIRFLFLPNSAELDVKNTGNLDNLASMERLLQVSPGSTLLLRGHVDDARKEEFRRQGGEAFVREMALKAIDLSTQRARAVETALVDLRGADEKRVETVGIGWEEPVDRVDTDKNRRVEVQWFTVE
jgi:NitT/TauT family transport system substrate-binding protein